MKIIGNFLIKNPCYRSGKKITVQGLMLHSVGVPQPNAQVFLKNWNNESYNRACVHAFIDGNTGNIYQTLPWNHRGWHGGGNANNTHIGVEMCEPATIKYTGVGANFTDLDPDATKAVVLRTYKSAVELFAYLCKEYGLNPMTDIISHSEGYLQGIASNHGDVEHLWKKFGLTMDGFRMAVRAKMNEGGNLVQEEPEKPVREDSTASYRVKVTADVLNIRKGAGTKHKITGKITDHGVYTIVEEENGWGKLKSGAGWIYLKYTKKL